MLRYFSLWFALFALFHLFVAFSISEQKLSFAAIFSTLAADFLWALFFGSVVALLAKRGVGKLLALALAVLLVLFLLVAFGFVKLYERPFAFTFVRLDSASIWKENLVSAFYEMGFPHLLFILFAAGILFLQNKYRVQNKFFGYFLVATFALGGLLGLAFFTQSPPEVFSNPISAAFYKKSVTHEFAQMKISPNDVIPSLDSPDVGPYMRPVKVVRRSKRNVIFYYLESTPFSVIGKKIQGREITPHLNKLKERSIFFERHYANFPLSINAFYNSFCSAYALPDGAWISMALPDFKVPCLSEILAKEGYHAAALHAGYLGYAKQKRFLKNRAFSLMKDAETLKVAPYDEGMGPWGAADERAMIRPLVDFANAHSPFLALLFAFAPHHPYNLPSTIPSPFKRTPEISASQTRYFNSLHFSDGAFGEIFAQLEKAGVLNNTILVVFGDHGEAFYEHKGNYNHPFFLYEENIHVPLFIWYKGITPQTVGRVTSHVDILPTVLDLLDEKQLESPLHVGRSMLRGGQQSLAHIQAYWQDEMSGIVDREYKYIRKETGEEELYDLLNDPSEKKNLVLSDTEHSATYRVLTQRAFQQKKNYYKKYADYTLVRFNPASQDK